MSFLQPLGLLGPIGVPIIIIIYIIKSRYVQKPVASTFIWKRSLKYMKRRKECRKGYKRNGHEHS